MDFRLDTYGCLEKFVVCNGDGGNGKSLINDFMLKALGNYGFSGNNSILFENNKTGSNPEKANIHKKRYVVFREPPEKKRMENSVMKELTGGGCFSARTHHEQETEKELNLTLVMECNKRPLFAEEPKNSELRRIIDIPFRSTFTDENSLIEEKNYIFASNPLFKDDKFQHKHKYALLKILFEEHKKYKNNESKLDIPQSIVERTNAYLESSCDILSWFKEKYKKTNNKNDIIQIKDINELFSTSSYFSNLSKMEKRKYNKTFLTEYFRTNIFLKTYYTERSKKYRNFIHSWKEKYENEDSSDDSEKIKKKYNENDKINDLKFYIEENIANNELWKTTKDKKFIELLTEIKNNEIINDFLEFYTSISFFKDDKYSPYPLIEKIKELYKYIIDKICKKII